MDEARLYWMKADGRTTLARNVINPKPLGLLERPDMWEDTRQFKVLEFEAKSTRSLLQRLGLRENAQWGWRTIEAFDAVRNEAGQYQSAFTWQAALPQHTGQATYMFICNGGHESQRLTVTRATWATITTEADLDFVPPSPLHVSAGLRHTRHQVMVSAADDPDLRAVLIGPNTEVPTSLRAIAREKVTRAGFAGPPDRLERLLDDYLPDVVPRGWQVELAEGTLHLEADETRELTVELYAPTPGDYVYALALVDRADPTQFVVTDLVEHRTPPERISTLRPATIT